MPAFDPFNDPCLLPPAPPASPDAGRFAVGSPELLPAMPGLRRKLRRLLAEIPPGVVLPLIAFAALALIAATG